jgi:hypothetical protein
MLVRVFQSCQNIQGEPQIMLDLCNGDVSRAMTVLATHRPHRSESQASNKGQGQLPPTPPEACSETSASSKPPPLAAPFGDRHLLGGAEGMGLSR